MALGKQFSLSRRKKTDKKCKDGSLAIWSMIMVQSLSLLMERLRWVLMNPSPLISSAHDFETQRKRTTLLMGNLHSIWAIKSIGICDFMVLLEETAVVMVFIGFYVRWRRGRVRDGLLSVVYIYLKTTFDLKRKEKEKKREKRSVNRWDRDILGIEVWFCFLNVTSTIMEKIASSIIEVYSELN